MAGNVVALRPEVLTPEVLPPAAVTDAELLDRVLADVRDAVGQLEGCAPDGVEVGRWLRARLGEHVACRISRRG